MVLWFIFFEGGGVRQDSNPQPALIIGKTKCDEIQNEM